MLILLTGKRSNRRASSLAWFPDGRSLVSGRVPKPIVIPPRTPLRVAIIAFVVTVVVGGLVGTAIMISRTEPGYRRRTESFKYGVELGVGLGIGGAVCAGVAYFIQRRRTRHDKR